MKNDQRILISGAGIAGFTLAYWLKERGFAPTIIERHPFARGGGYKEIGHKQFLVQDPDGYLLRFFEKIGSRVT